MQLQAKKISITIKKDDRVIIEDFSYVLRANDKTVIIGEEGNGKSTILKLLYSESLIKDYAVKMELIPKHPMDKLVVPRADRHEATFYNADELNELFEVFKGDKLELVVNIAAYYGLRRCEILGLRWDAIDFKNKTITIQRKIVSDYDENGEMKIFVETRLKTNSTRRTLPLIPHIEEMLLEKKKTEVKFKKACGKSYNKEFDGFICRDNYGNMLSPGYVTQHFHYRYRPHKDPFRFRCYHRRQYSEVQQPDCNRASLRTLHPGPHQPQG